MQANELYNYDAEIHILSLLIESGTNTEKHEIIDQLSAADFYDLHNSRIFTAIGELVSDKILVDTISTGQRLNDSNVEYGGYSCLQEIARINCSLYQSKNYIKIIIDLSIRRQVMQHSFNLSESIQNNITIEELSALCESGSTITQQNYSGVGKSKLGDCAGSFIDELELRVNANGKLRGLSTGIDSIDSRIRGIGDSWLVVVAGRPSHGKTFFTQNIAENIAINNQETILFFSMEMSKDELYERSVVGNSGVNPLKIESGQNLTDEDWGRIAEAQSRITNSKFEIDDRGGLSLQQIKAKARRVKKDNPDLKAIFVDFLGLMKKGKADRNDIAVGDNAIGLKNLAKELQTPIILLVQANRAADTVSRPTMSNIKDSSDIEAAADLILFVHRDEVSNPDTDLKGITEIIWAKDRHRRYTGTEYLTLYKNKLVPVHYEEIARIKQMQESKNQPKYKRGMN